MIRGKRGRWEVVVYAGRDPATGKERRISRMAPTEAAAVKLERRLARQVRTDQIAATTATLGVLLDRWLAVARRERSTRHQDAHSIERWIRPRLGAIRLVDLSPETLDRYYLELEEHLGAWTIRHHHRILHAALAMAWRWEWLERNPATHAHPPPIPSTRPTAPETDVVAKLLSAAAAEDPRLHVALRLSTTGLRPPGEVVALTRADVVGSRLRRRAAIGTAPGGPYRKATKTGRADVIALGPTTTDIVHAHLADQDRLAACFGITIAPDGYLFSHEPDASKPWWPAYLSRRFGRLRDACGLSGIRLYDLRRYASTQLAEAGFDPTAIASRLGHARPSTTLDHYTATSPARDAALGDALDATLG